MLRGKGSHLLADQMQYRIVRLREEFGLTGTQLALIIGMGPERVQALEQGATDPAVAELVQIADAFGISVDWLLGRSEPKWGWRLQQIKHRLSTHLSGLTGGHLIQMLGATTTERITYIVGLMRQHDPALLQDWYIAGWLGLSQGSAARLLRGELDATTPVIARMSDMTGVPETWFRTGDPKVLVESDLTN